MRKAAIFYNPHSGRRRKHRLSDVDAVLSVFRAAGVEAQAAPTHSSAGSAGQVRQAIAEGCDTIVCAGGDGTINDLLQGLAGSNAALAIIPLGTANSLAHDLDLPFSPPHAARAALQAEPRRFAAGRVAFVDFDGKPCWRYFTVAAGIGVDAQLFYQLSPLLKRNAGMTAYYAEAWKLWMSHKMQPFVAECHETGNGTAKSVVLTELLAVRIRNFGNVLRELAPGAALHRNDLRLIMCRTDSRSRYLLYVLRGLLGQSREVDGIDLVHSEKISCTSIPAPGGGTSGVPKVYVEADGEILGTLPVEISMAPDAFTLLVPVRK